MTDISHLIEPSYAFQDLIGYTQEDWREGYARFELTLGDHHMNRYGIPHGGVLATLLDTVMGFSGCFTGDRQRPALAMTLSMNVSYLAQAQGRRLTAEGTRTGGGRKTFFADGKILDETGALLATSTGVFRVRGKA